MKNGKSCGEDGIYIEYIKYAPTELHKEISNILNSIQSEEPPPEIVTGLLSALQKPGKNVGPLLEPGELYYLSILTNRPKLKIKLNNLTSDPFTTTQGIMQGDCLSAILFIFYLAKALKDSKIKIMPITMESSTLSQNMQMISPLRQSTTRKSSMMLKMNFPPY